VDKSRAAVDNPPNLVEILSGAGVELRAASDAERHTATAHESTPAVGSTGGAPLTPPPVESLRRGERMDPTSSLSERLLWHGYGLDEELEP
jgi:hypothetical protein